MIAPSQRWAGHAVIGTYCSSLVWLPLLVRAAVGDPSHVPWLAQGPGSLDTPLLAATDWVGRSLQPRYGWPRGTLPWVFPMATLGVGLFASGLWETAAWLLTRIRLRDAG
jgi:hypothetical protein